MSAASVREHIDENFSQLSGINLPFVHETHCRVRVVLDGVKRLIQFVGERGRHFAKQAHAAKKLDLFTAMLRFFLSGFAR